MRTRTHFLSVLALTIFLLVSSPVLAALVSNADGTVTDTATNLVWYQLGWGNSDPIGAVNTFNNTASTDWRLPTGSPTNGGELHQLYSQLPAYVQGSLPWPPSSWPAALNFGDWHTKIYSIDSGSGSINRLDFYSGNWYDNSSTLYWDTGTLVVRSVVPIPAAAWLLGTGLAGLAAIRRKAK